MIFTPLQHKIYSYAIVPPSYRRYACPSISSSVTYSYGSKTMQAMRKRLQGRILQDCSFWEVRFIPAFDAAPRRGRLRSANRNCLTVPRCRLSTYGCRAFDYAGPTVWNSLPDELRNSDSFDSFKRFTKTILFSRY